MKDKSPVKGRTSHLVGVAPRAESAILSSGCGSLGALEKHLPGIFVCHVEEPAQSLVPRRVEHPQVESLLLIREDPTNEHNLDYVNNFEIPVH